MVSIADALAYLYRHYPRPNELSAARTVYMLYLADWRSAIQFGEQITPVKWYLHERGPEFDLKDEQPNLQEALKSLDTAIVAILPYGNPKAVDRTMRVILDFVIDTVSSKSFDELAKLVYSTYPVLTQPQGGRLNLIGLAQRYKTKSKMVTA